MTRQARDAKVNPGSGRGHLHDIRAAIIENRLNLKNAEALMLALMNRIEGYRVDRFQRIRDIDAHWAIGRRVEHHLIAEPGRHESAAVIRERGREDEVLPVTL